MPLFFLSVPFAAFDDDDLFDAEEHDDATDDEAPGSDGSSLSCWAIIEGLLPNSP